MASPQAELSQSSSNRKLVLAGQIAFLPTGILTTLLGPMLPILIIWLGIALSARDPYAFIPVLVILFMLLRLATRPSRGDPPGPDNGPGDRDSGPGDGAGRYPD